MVVDIGEVKKHIKPKADSTLQNMRKADLIAYIRTLEHNYNVAVSFNENQARYVESLGAPRKWIPVAERLPENFVSVLGYMTDAGPFPPVRECYTIGKAFYFPALLDVHPVSHWMPLPEPPKEV